MIDVLYCLEQNGSNFNDFEIRHSILSLLKFGNPNRIYIAGYCNQSIKSLSNKITHIPHTNKNATKSYKIASRIAYALNHSDIEDNFIWFADDYILTKKVDLSIYPHYQTGILDAKPQSSNYSFYKHSTAKYLKELGFNCLNFDCHTPIRYNKSAFLDIFATHHKAGKMYLVKSMYCNVLGIEGTLTNDSKVDKSGVNGVISLSESINEITIKRIRRLLND